MRPFRSWMPPVFSAVLACVVGLTGCDQVQDLVEEQTGESEPAATDTASQPAVTNTGTATQPATTQQSTPPDPATVLAQFRALPPSQITEAALKSVADVPEAAAQIVDLDMNGANVGPGSLGLLSKLPNLKTVKLTNAKAQPGGFAGFTAEAQFEEIDLDRSQIDGAGISSLATVRTLKRINLQKTPQVQAQDLIPLGNLTELIDLNLSETRANDSLMPVLAKLPIARLNLAKTGVTNAGLPAIASIKTLEDLSLAFCVGCTGQGFAATFKGAQLKKLNVGETPFGVDGMVALRGMKTLEELVLYRAGIVQHTKANVFGSLPKLKKLNIGGNAIDDAGLVQGWFKSGCQQLEELNISNHRNVTNAGLAGLVRLKALKQLNCVATAVNQTGALALKRELPEVAVETSTGTF